MYVFRYVSLEMAYLAQSFFLQQDLALYDPARDSPAECHSSGMCADLGQVSIPLLYITLYVCT